jgi:hypothetical protein
MITPNTIRAAKPCAEGWKTRPPGPPSRAGRFVLAIEGDDDVTGQPSAFIPAMRWCIRI